MDSGLKTISSLFDGAKKLVIPTYQRNYAWENPQWKEFWEDVYYHTVDQKYFFGTILLKEAQKDDDFTTFEIVDGQQRLTTTIIFINSLIHHLKSLNHHKGLQLKREKYIEYHNVHKLKVSELDNEFFQTYILKETIITPYCATPSQRRMFTAKKYFEECIDKLNEDDSIRILHMIENAEILVYSVKNSAEATLIFETTNDRGKELTSLEKIKSFLMYKAYLSAGNNASDVIDRIHTRIGEIYRVVERIKPVFQARGIIEVSEDQICQYHFIAEFPWNNKIDYQNYVVTIKDHLNSLTYNNLHSDIINFIETYTSSLKESFNTFEQLLNFKHEALDDIIYIGKVAVFFPILIIAYKADTTSNKCVFNSILEALEKFSGCMYLFNTKKRYDQTYNFNCIASEFGKNRNFANLRQSIKDKISNNWYVSDLQSTLNENDIYNYWDGKALRYLFWKYENYLRTQFQPVSNKLSYEEFSGNDSRYRFTIEHITSQTPINGLSFPESTEDFSQYYLHCLGNLTICPQSSNSSMGNDIWETKNTKYFTKAPFKTHLELSDFVESSSKEWDTNAIKARREKIVKFAMDRWELS